MPASTLTIESDGAAIFMRRWLPDAPPRAIVEIVHGLCEHSARYEPFALALNAAGFGAYALDLPGHGLTAPPGELGFFGPSEGWRKCLDAIAAARARIEADFPGAPIIVMGHSMGSILTQQYIAESGAGLAGAILSGSDGAPPAILPLGRLVARVERARLGPRGHSALLFQLLFGGFNKRFKPARTDFDWLSRDPAEVDKYIADPLCGFPYTTQLVVDLLGAVGPIGAPATAAKVPKDLPIYIASGSEDPVGPNLKGLIAAYRAQGIRSVTTHIYPGARHEILNETNRDEVTADLIAWLQANVGAGGA